MYHASNYEITLRFPQIYPGSLTSQDIYSGGAQPRNSQLCRFSTPKSPLQSSHKSNVIKTILYVLFY